MNGRRTMLLVAALALLSIAGIVGMLLADGAWDGCFLALTALPLIVGSWRVHTLRKTTGKST